MTDTQMPPAVIGRTHIMTIEEFCDAHSACAEGRQWALFHCLDMNNAWRTLKPEWLVWVATRKGVLTDKELRLFAVWSARQVQDLMSDQRSIDALDVAERCAHGNATSEQLAAARAAAWAAARAAAWAAQAEWLRKNTTPNFGGAR